MVDKVDKETKTDGEIERTHIRHVMKRLDARYPGIWVYFVKLRDTLKSRGVELAERNRQAREETFKHFSETIPGFDSDPMNISEMELARRNYREKGGRHTPVTTSFPGCMDGQADVVKAMEFVGKCLTGRKERPAFFLKYLDPPTAALAWTFYDKAMSDADYRDNFIKNLPAKLVSRTTNKKKEEDESNELDSIGGGKLSRIEEISKNAVLSSGS